MEKKTEKLLEKNVSKEFKEISKNFIFKLNQIMDLTTDAESLYILNLTLKVIERRFGQQ